MKIFFAGIDDKLKKKISPFLSEPQSLNILLSYYSVKNKSIKELYKENKIFLDSGAFSVKNLGVKIEIGDYIKYIRENIDGIKYYANLDVIKNPEETLKNQQIMEKEGLHPIPVFHLGSDPDKYLVPLIENYKHIAIGGAIGEKSTCFDYLFLKYLIGKEIKIHGFGATGFSMMIRYPWYSTDSTTAIKMAGYGWIYIPVTQNKSYVFNGFPMKFHYTEIPTLSKERKNLLQCYLEEKNIKFGKSRIEKVSSNYVLKEGEKWVFGKRKESTKKIEIIIEEGICNSYDLRVVMNVIYYQQFEKAINENPKYLTYINKNFLF